jgi:hypothetical protein
MAERDRIAAAKALQGHDTDPPRCANCAYFRREPHTLYLERRSRGGRLMRVKARANPKSNPLVDRCSFGNFEVKPHHICNEWHGRDGTRLGEVSDG